MRINKRGSALLVQLPRHYLGSGGPGWRRQQRGGQCQGEDMHTGMVCLGHLDIRYSPLNGAVPGWAEANEDTDLELGWSGPFTLSKTTTGQRGKSSARWLRGQPALGRPALFPPSENCV